MTGGHIGRSQRRLEDWRFLTGQGRYVDDIDVPGQLHGIVLRSPHGHAAIEGIDTTAAQTMPGVHGVLTTADLDADGIGELPCIARVATVAPMIVPPRRALARDRVRHVGDPVAFIVADTAQQARDAAERVVVTYRPLPAVVDATEALAAQAPQLWDEAPGNLSYRFERGDKPAVNAVFAAAAHIVEIELVNNRLVVAPIEPRAGIGTYDAAADRFDLLLTGQGVHSLRQQLADAVFRMPPDRITVRAPDVGGGFGVKNFLYPEWVLVLWAARRLRRSVKWLAERGEEFVSGAVLGSQSIADASPPISTRWCSGSWLTALRIGDGTRWSAAGCAGSASPAFSKHRAARRANALRSASRRTGASQSCSARSRTAKATRPASHRSPPISWGCRFLHSALSKLTRGRSGAATGMAAPVRCIWAGPLCVWRYRWCCPRRVRLLPTCCRLTRTR